MPALTLAPGGVGGAVVSDNITVTNLLNVKRLAYPTADPPPGAYEHAPDVKGALRKGGDRGNPPSPATSSGVDDDRVERIVARVLAELGGGR
jgi:acetaldehyde dehydrogenase (acetylating)